MTCSPSLSPSTLTQATQSFWPRDSNQVQGQRNQQIQAPTETWSKLQHTHVQAATDLFTLPHKHMQTQNTQTLNFRKQNISLLGCRVEAAWASEPRRPGVPSLPITLTWTSCLSCLKCHFFKFVKCRQEHLGLFQELMYKKC